MFELIIVESAVILALLIVAGFLLFRFRGQKLSVVSTTRPLAVVRKLDSGVKCHIKKFIYENGHTEVRHSGCAGLSLDDLTDEKAQGFYSTAKLVKVVSTVHEVGR